GGVGLTGAVAGGVGLTGAVAGGVGLTGASPGFAAPAPATLTHHVAAVAATATAKRIPVDRSLEFFMVAF
ncbi:MAG TPA: hypothetical protein PLF40_15785, partial [Kofleriaceae bacterium]|nr:hypothetical protein [Kofleriaceae bacterium]